MTTTIYGIKNCDTVKKAKKWLDENGVDYHFHDFRTDGIDNKLIQNWLEQLDWKHLLNTRGTTWRKLSEKQRNSINKKQAISIMLVQPAIIKRPVLSINKQYYVGFNIEKYETIFN